MLRKKKNQTHGSILYYEIDVEYDESWEGLTIKGVIVAGDEDTGKAVSLINNKIYIDSALEGVYNIGFVGYTIENNKKVYQISTNLKTVNFNKGAGQIETEEGTLPTPTQWEIYIEQIQSIVGEITGLAEDLDAEVQDIITQLENGDFDGADGITPTIGQNGNWYLGDIDTGKPSRGENGTNGTNGTNGQDGFSPIASVTQTSGGATISITDKNGTTTANVVNGTNGQNRSKWTRRIYTS